MVLRYISVMKNYRLRKPVSFRAMCNFTARSQDLHEKAMISNDYFSGLFFFPIWEDLQVTIQRNLLNLPTFC